MVHEKRIFSLKLQPDITEKITETTNVEKIMYDDACAVHDDTR